MMVNKRDVSAGSYFLTDSNQLRKVTFVGLNEHGVMVVHYLSKSALIKMRKFDFAHTKNCPPTIDSFICSCGRLLDGEEIERLRAENIILQDE